MYDIITPWMIAGRVRADRHDPHAIHRRAIYEARRSATVDGPSIVERIQARFAMPNPTPATCPCEV